MTRRRRTIGAAAAAAVTGLALLLGGVLRGESAPRPGVQRETAEALAAGFRAGDTAGLVARLQDELRRRPRDGRALDLLGLAYEQRARETGDPSWYPRSEGVLRRALALDARDVTAVSGLGSLALSRHRFRLALALGRRAVALSPTTARSYGVVGDALVELGRYREAFAAFDRLARLKPGLGAYARVSYARELRGDVAGAAAAMRLAIDAAAAQPEPTAWGHVQLGKLLWGHGHARAAAREYGAALAALPGYVYAEDALAQVEAARGRLDAAIALERRAVATIPLPQFVGTLGDLYRLAGRSAEARRQYGTIRVIETLLASNGVRTDLETALFDVDHGLRLRHALALAARARALRPSIDGDDVLAWALVRNDRCAEALPLARRALRLGTLDAAKLFHRGMAERCLGHPAAARMWFRRALALNPHFSLLWAPVARRALG